MSELLSFFAEHWVLSLLFVLLFLYLINLETQGKVAGANQVTPAELVACLNHKNGHVVDIRPKEDFLAGHIVGAQHIDANDMDKAAKRLSKHRTHPVVLCGPDKGKLLHDCATALRKLDFSDVRVLSGGMDAWELAGMPSEKG